MRLQKSLRIKKFLKKEKIKKYEDLKLKKSLLNQKFIFLNIIKMIENLKIRIMIQLRLKIKENKIYFLRRK